jgi:CRISPR-associated protein Cmr1
VAQRLVRMNRKPPPAAPAFAALPPLNSRTATRSAFTVELATVTPILGGGYRARELDDVDCIRVPTVRGHLRFWWRALFAHTDEFKNAAELYKAESDLWGGPGSGSKDAQAVRSLVEVRIEVTDRGTVDEGDIRPGQTDGAYVLFPARGESERGRDPIPRRNCVKFKLHVAAPMANVEAVRASVRAWILFGGYGGRTRRGLGSLMVTGRDAAEWLPRNADTLPAELKRLFGRDVFAASKEPRQLPMLAGASLYTMTGSAKGGIDAWCVAVNTLRDFRQGVPPKSSPLEAADAPSEWPRRPGTCQRF